MFEAAVNLIKASRPIQFALVFIAGGAVAAIFYPTKQIKESLQKTFQQQITTVQQQDAQTLATQQASYQKLQQQYSDYQSSSNEKINELTNQVSNLKSHNKTTTFKIVHPDGTVEERDTTESDVDQTDSITQQVQAEWQQKVTDAVTTTTQQFQQQISTLQTQWSSKEQSYQSQIASLTQTKSVTTNPKNFTLDVGGITNGDYYGHVTYNVWGPFILGLQGQFGASSAAGAGLGLRF
jgi:hypothetical protein